MKRTILALTLTALMLISFGALVYAQVGGGFDLRWSVVAGGGTTSSSGGSYSLGGTAGQPATGASSGGTYSLQSGFWSASGVTPTPTVQAVLVSHVVWQGRPAQPSPMQQMPVTLTLKLGATEVNYPVANTDAGGSFTTTLGTLPAGTYQWRVKGPKYLANSGTIAWSGSSTTAEMAIMRVGDANNDNTVGASDFNILKATFGKAGSDPSYDPRADFNGDNTVGAPDFNLLKGNFGTSGAPPL